MPGKKISLDEIRSKYIAETDNLAKNLRFVLFSHPPGLGIGDDTYTKLAKNKIDHESGLVRTEPRNILIACPKHIRSRKSYFSFQDYKGTLKIVSDCSKLKVNFLKII